MRTTLSLCLSVLLAPLLSAQIEPGQVVTKGKYFEVHCHFEDKALGPEALKAAELAWQTAVKSIGASKRKPSKRMQVHLYRTVDDFQVIEKRLTRGANKDNWAFEHFDSKAAFIVVQPLVDDATLSAIGLPMMTRRLVVYHCLNLATQLTYKNFRQHPTWFSQGLSSWLMDESFVKGGYRKSALEDPYDATRIHWAQTLSGDRGLPSAEVILTDPELGKIDGYFVYPVYRTFFSMLMKDYAKDMKSVLKKVRGLPGSESFKGKLVSALKKKLGKKWSAIDAAYKKNVTALKPVWDERYKSLDTGSSPWVQIAAEKEHALAWQIAKMTDDSFSISAKVRMLPAEAPQIKIGIGRQDDGSYLYVGFQAQKEVYAMAFDAKAKGEKWVTVARAGIPDFVVGKDAVISLNMTKGQISVMLDGKNVLSVDTGGRPVTGQWGIGVAEAGTALWSQVTAK